MANSIFKRADGTGYVAVFLGQDAEAVAVGNGYDGMTYEDIQTRNAIAHAHVSADITVQHDRALAETLGDWKETTPGTIDSADEYRDQFNDEVGRQIGDWLKNWLEAEALEERTYTDEQVQGFLDDLIVDAHGNGDLIWDVENDPRLEGYDQDPASHAAYGGPSISWQSTSAGRDYSMADGFTENPIGFTLNIPQEVAEAALPLLNNAFPTIGHLLDNLASPGVDTLKPLADWIDGVLSPFGVGESTSSPLVLDLAGTGISLVALNDEGSVYWNITNGDFANASGWIADGTGLLCIDLNEDGIINDHSELFGTSTTDGFTVLSAYDSNNSDTITNADTDWGDLLVWTDDNHDGYSQADELHSLDELLITSIDLVATPVNYDIEGNHISHESTFTMNGNTRDIVDAWFAYDTVNTVYASNYELDISTLLLPTLRGYGQLPDLHIAMSLDEDLRDMVVAVSTADLEEVMDPSYDFSGKVRDIMFQWAGVQDVDPGSRGGNIDARVIGFLEAFVGREVDWFSSPNNIGGAPVQYFTEAFNNALDAFAARLGVQSAIAGLFTDAPLYNPVTDTFGGEPVLNLQAIEDLSGEFNHTDPVDSVLFWRQLLGTIHNLVDLGTLDSGVTDDIDTIIQNDDPSGDLTYDILTDSLFSSTPLTLNGDGNDNVLLGAAWIDSINGYGGADTIFGNRALDDLYGGTGNDTYVFSRGDGYNYVNYDSVHESLSEGTDTIRFAPGIDPNDVLSWTDMYGHLYIKYSDTDIVKIFAGTTVTGETRVGEYVEQVVFGDSTVWDLTAGLHLRNTHISGGTVVGSSYGDVIEGGAGTEYIYGYGGNDILINGGGNDAMDGGTGDDLLIFAPGQHSASDTGGTDTLWMTGGTTINDVSVTDSGTYNAYVTVAWNNAIYVTDLRNPTTSLNIDIIRFDDGFSADLPSYNSWIKGTSSGETVNGTSSADVLIGYAGNDTINAGAANDNAHGGAGDDTIYGDAGADLVHGGDGDDTLYGGDDADLLYGGAGADSMTGGNGDDTFVFMADSAFANVDTVTDFNISGQEDVLDISDILDGTGYQHGVDAVTDWVQITTSGSDSVVKVDVTGTGTFGAGTQIATLTSITGLTDEAALASSGNLLLAA